MTYYIYKITNKINKKKYIGQSNDPDARFEKHMDSSHNAGLRKDVKLLGKDKFSIEILAETQSPISINFMEINNIEDENNLYNKSVGGQLVHNEDRFVCKICNEVGRTTFQNDEKTGIILFDRKFERYILLCAECKQKPEGVYNVDQDMKRFSLAEIIYFIYCDIREIKNVLYKFSLNKSRAEDQFEEVRAERDGFKAKYHSLKIEYENLRMKLNEE